MPPTVRVAAVAAAAAITVIFFMLRVAALPNDAIGPAPLPSVC